MTTLRLTILLLFALCFQFNGAAQNTNIRSFMFGHSLMDHRPPLIPTPSNETTIAHWIYLLSQEAGNGYAATGQYGFLPQHANLPPIAQWGYDIVPPAWDSDNEPFAQADFNNILITAGNFMQWQGPAVPYPGQASMSPVSATQDIVDWLVLQEDSLDIFIYENWPDMAGFLGNGFPPTATEFANYNAYTTSTFHDWWLEYHDSLLLSHPAVNVRMIPLGPLLADLLTTPMLSNIPLTELYEDDAPHGRATIYFLAGMITYMAIYEQPTPASYTVPAIVHADVQNNYAAITSHMWNYLLAFTDANGNNRVFPASAPLPVELLDFSAKVEAPNIALNWLTATEIDNDKFEVEHSLNGSDFSKVGEVKAQSPTITNAEYSFLHTAALPGNNYYRLKQIDLDASFTYSETVVAQLSAKANYRAAFSPNPSSTGQVQLRYLAPQDEVLVVEVFDLNGRRLRAVREAVQRGAQTLHFDFSELGRGVFVVKINGQGAQFCERLLIY